MCVHLSLRASDLYQRRGSARATQGKTDKEEFEANNQNTNDLSFIGPRPRPRAPSFMAEDSCVSAPFGTANLPFMSDKSKPGGHSTHSSDSSVKACGSSSSSRSSGSRSSSREPNRHRTMSYIRRRSLIQFFGPRCDLQVRADVNSREGEPGKLLLVVKLTTQKIIHRSST